MSLNSHQTGQTSFTERREICFPSFGVHVVQHLDGVVELVPLDPAFQLGREPIDELDIVALGVVALHEDLLARLVRDGRGQRLLKVFRLVDNHSGHFKLKRTKGKLFRSAVDKSSHVVTSSLMNNFPIHLFLFFYLTANSKKVDRI